MGSLDIWTLLMRSAALLSLAFCWKSEGVSHLHCKSVHTPPGIKGGIWICDVLNRMEEMRGGNSLAELRSLLRLLHRVPF